jgi:hypothetical protein
MEVINGSVPVGHVNFQTIIYVHINIYLPSIYVHIVIW